jgi:FSR family fosmidomycin resistance protein-like MFS transporter
MTVSAPTAQIDTRVRRTVVPVLLAISFSHLLNDTIQSLLPAIYPLLKESFALSFAQVGLITFCFQVTASLLQPFVGHVTDRRPFPYSLPVGMTLSLSGLLLLSVANSFPLVLLAAALIGTGSSVFHPESSRVARMASGGRHGLAQSVFQVGGNVGTSLGPLLAAFIVVPHGRTSVAWFALIALLAIAVLFNISRWRIREASRVPVPSHYEAHGHGEHADTYARPVKNAYVVLALLVALMFAKFLYLTSMSNYYTFYLIHHFGVSVPHAQTLLFVYLGALAAGTVAGGPIGDRIGRKTVILVSVLGPLPFTLAMPHLPLFWAALFTVPIGFILASAFPAMVVYAQELFPGRVGTISGLFFGLAFGLGGIGAAILGWFADLTSIEFVFTVCSFLPILGLVALFLPNMRDLRRTA